MAPRRTHENHSTAPSTWATEPLVDDSTLFELSPIAMSITRPNGEITVNPAFCELLGYECEELADLISWERITHPDDVEASYALIAGVLAGDTDSATLVKRYLRRDGSVVWGDLRTRLHRDDAGAPLYFVTVIADVTSQYETQSRLESTQAKFAAAFTSSPDAVNVNRLADGMYLEVNEGFTELTGYTWDDVAGKTSAEISIWVDPRDRDRLVAGLVVNGAVRDLEATFRRKDGSTAVALMSAHMVEVDGETCILSVTRDISERKATEERLEQMALRNRTLLQAASDGIHVLARDGSVVEANKAYCDMLGYSMDEIMSLHVWDWDVQWTAEELLERIGELITHGGGVFETRHRRKDGSIIDVEISSIGVVLDGQELIFGSARDVTERRRLERALEQRIIALTQPPGQHDGITFHDLFDIEQIQAVQDTFAAATGVASMIVAPDGTPITAPSNFCDLCTVIRSTEVGRENCKVSDAVIGASSADGPTIGICMSGGLLDAGASIYAGGQHIANWLVGQVLDETHDLDNLLDYATQIGADIDEFESALGSVPRMPREQFERITQVLHTFANELSIVAYQNIQQARFIAERARVEAELAREQQRNVENLEQSLESIVGIVGQLAEIRDPYTAGHQQRVSQLAERIAREMGMPDDRVREVRIAALLHDIGKMSIPAEILSKPGTLSELELELIQDHARAGHRIVASANLSGDVAEIVLQHHERCDGSGYPHGLSGDQILPASRIIMVADVVEAMVSHRPYRAGLGLAAALGEISDGAGVLYDRTVVETCLQVFESGFDFES